ncbi:hypothetical protein [Pseudomonas aphyarum]|uniref:Uncharacterized protein n=1 Tax=Pseudomonas aphyarum TaxID=2942629 RepID=A0ABT5PV38_9PSED|nr:hypothetical protein [Pseudomonas aphyarum]MDD0969699.1 hypothetical protein [Pseudomonas aphyarum]MDD1127779.1 hypothetical protein [Pseudomonas aphyarum]
MHPKNSIAPPGAQQLAPKRPYESCAGFDYYEVQAVYASEGFKVSYPGLLDETLAIELQGMLQPEVENNTVRIVWAAGWAQDFDRFLKMDERMTDMVRSVRSAERPGHEFLARLGQFGPYEGYAPQNGESESVARELEERS